MTPFLFHSDLAWRLGWTLLHSLWQLGLLATAAAALLVLVRRSASTRYLIACGGLAAATIMVSTMIDPAAPASRQ